MGEDDEVGLRLINKELVGSGRGGKFIIKLLVIWYKKGYNFKLIRKLRKDIDSGKI